MRMDAAPIVSFSSVTMPFLRKLCSPSRSILFFSSVRPTGITILPHMVRTCA